ncbi:MAG: hypothetical protein MZV63_06445 [Marinilabiliales bacterium]|nr:hypothetical protein [Marinilabiliales bacterium]
MWPNFELFMHGGVNFVPYARAVPSRYCPPAKVTYPGNLQRLGRILRHPGPRHALMTCC